VERWGKHEAYTHLLNYAFDCLWLQREVKSKFLKHICAAASACDGSVAVLCYGDACACNYESGGCADVEGKFLKRTRIPILLLKSFTRS
jgi:hypothetical protein